jgi:uncharacterized protein
MTKTVAIILALVAFPTLGVVQAARAQASAAQASTTPSKAEVLKFMELMQVRARVVQMMDGIGQQARLGAEEGFKQHFPNPTAEQLAKVDALAATIFKGMPVDDMVDAMVPIYQKHLTKSDLAAIIAFYSSPVGRKLLKEQPAMMSEAMDKGGEIARGKIADLNERLDREVARLAAEEQLKLPPAQKTEPSDQAGTQENSPPPKH